MLGRDQGYARTPFVYMEAFSEVRGQYGLEQAFEL